MLLPRSAPTCGTRTTITHIRLLTHPRRGARTRTSRCRWPTWSCSVVVKGEFIFIFVWAIRMTWFLLKGIPAQQLMKRLLFPHEAWERGPSARTTWCFVRAGRHRGERRDRGEVRARVAAVQVVTQPQWQHGGFLLDRIPTESTRGSFGSSKGDVRTTMRATTIRGISDGGVRGAGTRGRGRAGRFGARDQARVEVGAEKIEKIAREDRRGEGRSGGGDGGGGGWGWGWGKVGGVTARATRPTRRSEALLSVTERPREGSTLKT